LVYDAFVIVEKRSTHSHFHSKESVPQILTVQGRRKVGEDSEENIGIRLVETWIRHNTTRHISLRLDTIWHGLRNLDFARML